MSYQIAYHIEQITTDYHYSWIWLETTSFKKIIMACAES